MKKKFLSLLLVLALIIGTVPTLAYADPGSYSTGKNDSATYYANLPDNVASGMPSGTLGYNDQRMKCTFTEINGETFIKYAKNPGVEKDESIYSINFAKTVYADGYIDQEAVDTAAQNFWAWRIKADVNTTPISFSVGIGNNGADGGVGWLNVSQAIFIDNATRKVTTTAVTVEGGLYNITFNKDFDGWMIIDLSKNFISNYQKSSVTTSHKEYLLDKHNGQLHFYFHDVCHSAGNLDWSEGAYIAVGDMLMIENLDTFKSVRFSCDEIGHELEKNAEGTKKECEFCDYEESLIASGTYSTGVADTAYYYADVSNGGLALGGAGNVTRNKVEIDGETFVKFYNVTGDANNYSLNFAKTVYSDGKIDQTAVDLSKIGYWAWRIKADCVNGPVSFSIAFDNQNSGWLDSAVSATFIDFATREAVGTDVVQANVGNCHDITFNQDFDGWMVVDLSTAFINGYTPEGKTDKDFLSDYAGTLQFFFHKNCHRIADLDWTDAYIAVGDMLLVENLDTFKEYRFSCDTLGHSMVETESKDATCTEDGYILYECEFCDADNREEITAAHEYANGTCTICGTAHEDHEFKGGVCTVCGAANPVSYATGKNDTGSYFLNVPDGETASIEGINGGSYKAAATLVKDGNETFIKFTASPAAGESAYMQTKLLQITYGANKVDTGAVDVDKVNYLAFRLKADAGTLPIAFTMFVGDDATAWAFFDAQAAGTFIDNNTREETTAVTINGGYKAVTLPAEGFDGWMILELSKAFIRNYGNFGSTAASQKDFLFKEFSLGRFQISLHGSGASMSGKIETDWTDREMLLGDILMVENLDTFKSVRLSCDEIGHVLEATDDVTAPDCENKGYTIMKCKFCEHTERGNFVDATGHTWKETGRTQATCSVAEVISYVCDVCGGTKTETGAYAEHNMVANGNTTNATCTTPASYELECSYGCGTKETVKTGEIDPDAHSYKDGVCEYCGATEGEATIKNGDESVTYETFAEALEKSENGDTIILNKDIALDTSVLQDCAGYAAIFTIEGKEITIDLNGKNISLDAKEQLENDAILLGIFAVNTDGKLTLKDSVGTGIVSATTGGEDGAYLYALVLAYDGLLNIESGNYYVDYQRNGRGMIYSQVGDANFGANTNKGINVYGGNFALGNLAGQSNGSPWIFNTAGQNTGKYVYVAGGTFTADVFHQYYVFEVQTDEKYALKNNGDGTYSVVEAVAYVTERHWSSKWYTKNVGYATLEEAIAACQGPQTKVYYKKTYVSEQEVVVLLKDIELESDIAVSAGQSVVLDYGGYNITGGTVIAGEGNLIIK